MRTLTTKLPESVPIGTGQSREEFVFAVGKMGIPVIQLDEEELKRELEGV